LDRAVASRDYHLAFHDSWFMRKGVWPLLAKAAIFRHDFILFFFRVFSINIDICKKNSKKLFVTIILSIFAKIL
jgi:hypothetical protein